VHFRAIPFTLAVLGIFLLTGLATGSVLSGPPEWSLDVASVTATGLKEGRWWCMFTSVFFATNPLAYGVAAFMILLLLGLAERNLGTKLTAAFFAAGQFASVTLFLLVTQLANFAGDAWLGRMEDVRLIGPYAAVLVAALAASGRLPALWQRRLRTAVLSVSLLLVLYIGHAETVVGLLGALVGIAAGWWIQSDQGRLRRHRSTGRETRNLLALTVGIFAVGPILTAATRSPSGPLALLRDVVLNPLPTLNQLEASCGGTVDVSCLELGRHGFAGPLGLAVAVVPVILLLICADGMRRGRRLALRIAMSVQLGVTSLSAVYLSLFARIPQSSSRPHTAVMSSGFVHILPLVVVPLLLTALLWASRRQFRVQSTSRARRSLAAAVGGTWFVLAGSYAAVWFSAGGMERDSGLGGLGSELARQFLPVPIPSLYKRVFDGRNALEGFLFAYSGPVFWLVALSAVWLVLLGRHHPKDTMEEDREAAVRLIRQGGDSLSWMASWAPNRYWFTGSRDGAVAYQQHGSVALTLGGPLGPAANGNQTAAGFLRFCTEQALIPCFYSCTDELWPLLRERGFKRVVVAQETRLAIRGLEFKGKEWQNVRTALNRATKTGIKAVWGTYGSLSAPLRSQLSEVSEEWAAQKSVPEMGFTLGGVDELMDDHVLCCLAVDPDGLVHGVTSWLPVFDGGRRTSWTLDFMRRRSDGFPGVMEFLIASAVLELRSSVEVISLSGSPLAQDAQGVTPHHEQDDLADRSEGLSAILDVVGRALEPIYGFRSLATFKSRFKPEYRTLYLYYQDPLQLPAIGRALSRAYLPGLSVRQSARLLRTLVR
jgi:lysylphosphatidylglycerol synthetase-like protein (DUF2156 family)